RGGFIVNDSLWYVTGGAAWATVEDNLAFANSFNPASAATSTGFPSAFVAGTPVASFSHTKSGWTLGAGVETRLWGGWSAKLEYLYVDLGTVTDAFTIAGNPLFGGIALAAGQGPGSTFTITTNTHFTDNIVRVGLNYRPAMAADLGVRPIYKAPPPVWPWTGFYLGLNTGGSIGANSTTDGGVYVGAPAKPLIGTSALYGESFRHMPTGWIFGGQVGYNWQVSPVFVLGVEGDWQWSGQQDTAYVFGCGAQPTRGFFSGGAPDYSTCLSDQNRLRNFGTARARGGFIVNDSLWYVTGGAAWATVEDNLAFANSFNQAEAPQNSSPFVPGTAVASFSHTRSGWTLGAGVETRLWSGWSAKLEYLYVDLGTVTDAFTIAGNPLFGTGSGTLGGPQGPGSTFTTTTSTHFTDNIVRVGLNYKIW
ncbi:MAG TPA: outer membrane beta-barrel protein, partial [Isosphaeraceae bacterium]|nr:outer membrane beta-barrel protein [Isosphaeraceae bacterium]